MAGTLPGVEAARRRRTHHRGCGGGGRGWSELNPGGGVVSLGWTRRPVFCLFVSRLEPNPISSSSVLQRSGKNRVYHDESHGKVDESLGKVAREAKERLDERLRAKRTSHITRNKSDLGEERTMVGIREVKREVKREVFGCNKNPVMRWASKLGGWKASEQEECAVCLDRFKVGDKLVSLPCAHRFHSSCLFPWLQHHAHCPSCRFTILPP